MERLGGTALCQSAGDCAEPSQPVILDKGDSGRLEDLSLLEVFPDLFMTMVSDFSRKVQIPSNIMLSSVDQFYNVVV